MGIATNDSITILPWQKFPNRADFLTFCFNDWTKVGRFIMNPKIKTVGICLEGLDFES